MKPAVTRLVDRYYPIQGAVRYRDGTAPFYAWMLSSIAPSEAIVLNVGAGPTPDPLQRLRGKVKHLIGVDPDPVVLTNTDLHEAFVNDGLHLPFRAATFDAVYSDWTVEHVAEPVPFLREIRRVLKADASYWFRTTNRLHYATAISANTPHWFHRLVANRARALPDETHEPWPTRYRANRPSTIRRVSRMAGFTSCELRLVEPLPAYLQFSAVAFRLGVAYERLANRFDWLSSIRLTIYGRLR
jgi:SAM-dependent methyltransferase